MEVKWGLYDRERRKLRKLQREQARRSGGLETRDAVELMLLETIRDVAEVFEKDEERSPKQRLPEDTVRELQILHVLAGRVLWGIPGGKRVKGRCDHRLWGFFLEIGRRLPILASITKRDYCERTMGPFSSYENIRMILHREGNRQIVKDGRWNKAKREASLLEEETAHLYKAPVQLADKLWSEGDRALDWQMIKYLLSLEDHKHLDEKRFKKELMPVAERHCRVSGFKNGKRPTSTDNRKITHRVHRDLTHPVS